MAIQLILCMETTKKAATDDIYITDTIRHVYQLNNQIKISRIYMGTKTKYNSKDVLREIKEKIDTYTFGDTKVIYCIDTDDYEKNIEHNNELNEISRFCDKNGYDLVWFCHNVEDVFLGKVISDSQKVSEAKAFRTKARIKEIPLNQLSGNIKRVHTSNLLNILDKYLSRKA